MNKAFRQRLLVAGQRFFVARRPHSDPPSLVLNTMVEAGKTVFRYARGDVQDISTVSRSQCIYLDVPPVKRCAIARGDLACTIYRDEQRIDPVLSLMIAADADEASHLFRLVLDAERSIVPVDLLGDIERALPASIAAPIEQPRMSRQERAEALRGWFSTFGITSISVTAERYSMATAVDVKLPPGDRAKREALGKRIRELLEQLFPSYRNVSDPYADSGWASFRWSVD